jgi:hypothetical protein
MVRSRSVRGPFAVRSRFVYGSFMVRLWFVRGSFMVRSRFVYGSFAVRLWFVRGPFAVRLWFVYGSLTILGRSPILICLQNGVRRCIYWGFFSLTKKYTSKTVWLTRHFFENDIFTVGFSLTPFGYLDPSSGVHYLYSKPPIRRMVRSHHDPNSTYRDDCLHRSLRSSPTSRY